MSIKSKLEKEQEKLLKKEMPAWEIAVIVISSVVGADLLTLFLYLIVLRVRGTSEPTHYKSSSNSEVVDNMIGNNEPRKIGELCTEDYPCEENVVCENNKCALQKTAEGYFVRFS